MLREVASPEMVATLSASWMVTADLGHRDRLAGGPAVKMTSAMDAGTVMLQRPRAGIGVVRV